ncbi:glutathione S-transferase [Streptococcus dysgalactiae]|nr:glutathione S-transferase [Streptococcus dysgalactiae]
MLTLQEVGCEEILPKGKKPYQLYSLGTPNGIKATIMFEELKRLGVSGVDYDLFRIDISKGEQFGSDFVSIKPKC